MTSVSDSYPAWLKKKAPHASVLSEMRTLLDGLALHTVCQSAMCPNQGECFSQGTATFLIMGDICTRKCRFCAIGKGRPQTLDPTEPDNVAWAVAALKLRHVVITSVTRDDLEDGGARHFTKVTSAIREENPHTAIELLIPDFRGSLEALETIVASRPEVIGHNMETVPRLYHEVRPRADYYRSLNLLRTVKLLDGSMATKSGVMLGLGETQEEVKLLLADLRKAGCDMLTLGQYLAPSRDHVPVYRYIPPQEFGEYRKLAVAMGFAAVASAPFVRSSFNARELYSNSH